MTNPRGFLVKLDDQASFEKCCSQIEEPECHGFALEFDATSTSCAIDPSLENVSALLNARAVDKTSKPCLWLNLWGWTTEHESVIVEIEKHYGLSRRLAQSLCPSSIATGRPNPHRTVSSSRASYSQAGNLEGGINLTTPVGGSFTSLKNPATSFPDIFNAIWHYCTVDFGHRYICIGWHAVFLLPHTKISTAQSQLNAVRVWSSLLLCDDGTVVSVFESPPRADPATLKRIRQHQINIFCNVHGAASTAKLKNYLNYTAVRSVGLALEDSTAEMAARLFYYLFDNWDNLFDEVSGSEKSYRHQLEVLRTQMVSDQAMSEQINTLHQIGRQLASLKSIYKSYKSIIQQIVRNQAQSIPQVRRRPSTHHVPNNVLETEAQVQLQEIEIEVSTDVIELPLGTVIRFKRLSERIDLYAMNEVDECLKEKDALVQMNFNLISLREAQTVERLTRTTILLAKVTILFLPISLATSYFSMQLNDIQNIPLSTYWFTFMVVALLTILFLATFEIVSTRYSGKLVYRSMFKIFYDKRRKRST